MSKRAYICAIVFALSVFPLTQLNAQVVLRADRLDPRPFDSTESSDVVDSVVQALARERIVMAPRVGAGGNEPEQWRRYLRLQNSATDEILLELVSHESPVVRCYAFRALAERNHAATFPVLVRLITDTAVVPVFSSWSVEMAVADYVLDAVEASDDRFSCGFALDAERGSIVDSILLHTPNLDIDHRRWLLDDLTTTSENYQRLRQLALEENESSALAPLARYGQLHDRPIILAALRSSQYDVLQDGLEAVEEFPDTMFYSDLVHVFRELRRDHGEWGGLFSQVCGTLARFPQPSTVALFREALLERRKDRRQAIRWSVADAISRYPHPTFLALLPLVELNKEEAGAFRQALDEGTTD